MTVRELFGRLLLATCFVLMQNGDILQEGYVVDWYNCGEQYGDWFVDVVYVNYQSKQMVVCIRKEEK